VGHARLAHLWPMHDLQHKVVDLLLTCQQPGYRLKTGWQQRRMMAAAVTEMAHEELCRQMVVAAHLGSSGRAAVPSALGLLQTPPPHRGAPRCPPEQPAVASATPTA